MSAHDRAAVVMTSEEFTELYYALSDAWIMLTKVWYSRGATPPVRRDDEADIAPRLASGVIDLAAERARRRR